MDEPVFKIDAPVKTGDVVENIFGDQFVLVRIWPDVKGVRLLDPRTGGLTEPGDGNPALILYDLVRKCCPEKENPALVESIKAMADYCDEMDLSMDCVIRHGK